MFCKKCGKPLEDGSRFCSHCGERLEAATPVKPVNPAEIPAEEYRRRVKAAEASKNTQEPPKKKTSWLRWVSIACSIFFTGMGIFNYFKSNDGGNTNPEPKTVASSNVPKPNQAKTNNPTTTQKKVQGTTNTSSTSTSKSYSTKARPKIEDFNWTATVMKNGVWKNAKIITAFKDISGTWKCLNTYDPTRKMGKYCRDISNVTISGTEGNAKVLYDWYKIFYEGEAPQDMTKGPKTTMTGTYKKGSTGKFELAVSTKGSKLVIDQFYLYNGKQYAIGVIILADGTVGNVTMVRP